MRETILNAILGFFVILAMSSRQPETSRLPSDKEDTVDCEDCVIVRAQTMLPPAC